MHIRPTLWKYFIVVTLSFLTYYLSAQDSPLTGNAPITTAATAVACPSSSITVPVTVTAFNAITALTLRVEYDTTVLTFNASASSVNSSLLGYYIMYSDTINGGGAMHKITIVWDYTFPVTIPDGSTLVSLAFAYINGTSVLHFNNVSNNGGDCDYAGANYLPLIDLPTSTYYIDGQVSSGVQGGSVTGGSNITYGSSTGTLTLSGFLGSVIKWQKQYNGGGYTDIANTNTTYSETPTYTGAWNYRAVVQYGSCPQATSTPTTVIVTAVGNAKTWTGSATTDWNNVSNWDPPGIPMLTENVTIPSGPVNMPIVSTQNLGCNNLTVAGGATLKISTGIHLTINGTLNIGP